MNRTKTIRGLDEALYRQARASAALKEMTLGEWLNMVIKKYIGGK